MRKWIFHQVANSLFHRVQQNGVLKIFMFKVRVLKVQFKNVFCPQKEHLHSVVQKANFHLLYTFSLSILFWARKTSSDTLLAFKVSITVNILIERVLLHFSTFSEKLSCSKKYGYLSTSSFLCSKMSFPLFCSFSPGTLPHCLKSF